MEKASAEHAQRPTITALSGTADWRMTVSEVKRYDCSGTMCQAADGDWVCVELLQSAQSELAALREELAQKTSDIKDLTIAYCDRGEALTAAEQRNADLCGLLVRTLPVVRMVGRQDHLCDYAMAGNIQAEIETTLNPKPDESGASE